MKRVPRPAPRQCSPSAMHTPSPASRTGTPGTAAAVRSTTGKPRQAPMLTGLMLPSSRWIGPAEEMTVRASEGIKAPADFKGKKVATPFGSTSHFRLLGFLKTNGLSQAEVTVLDMKPAAIVAAWSRREIDAAYVWAPAKSKLLADGGAVYPTAEALDKAGYVIADLKMLTPTRSMLERHYEEHQGKPFFDPLVDFMASGPVVAVRVTGNSVIEGFRSLAGKTDPTVAAPGTIRGDLGRDWGESVQKNLVHGSDSSLSAERELGIWFG